MKFLVAAALVVATPVMAQTSAPAQPSVTGEDGKPAKQKEERQLCRKDARTSTRLVKRTCHTAAEWRELDKRTDGADNIVRNPD